MAETNTEEVLNQEEVRDQDTVETETAEEEVQQSSNEAILGKIYLTNVAMLLKEPLFVDNANEIYHENADATGKISGSKISVDSKQKSLIFKIRYTDSSNEFMNEKLNAIIASANINLNGKIMANNPSLKILQSDVTINENVKVVKDCLLGFLIGGVVAFALIYLVFVMDNTIKDKEELEKITGVVCLSHVEDLSVLKK